MKFQRLFKEIKPIRGMFVLSIVFQCISHGDSKCSHQILNVNIFKTFAHALRVGSVEIYTIFGPSTHVDVDIIVE